jgi:hypothetical protein
MVNRYQRERNVEALNGKLLKELQEQKIPAKMYMCNTYFTVSVCNCSEARNEHPAAIRYILLLYRFPILDM